MAPIDAVTTAAPVGSPTCGWTYPQTRSRVFRSFVRSRRPLLGQWKGPRTARLSRSRVPLGSRAGPNGLRGKIPDGGLDRELRPLPVGQCAIERVEGCVVPPRCSFVCPDRHPIAAISLTRYIGDGLGVMA
jgi:hypothetical protein